MILSSELEIVSTKDVQVKLVASNESMKAKKAGELASISPRLTALRKMSSRKPKGKM